MPVLNFIYSSLAFLLLLFGLHLFFAKLGNRLLNRLFSILFFARVGQILAYLLITSNELTVFGIVQQISTPLYFAAPACYFLYLSRFIDGRTYIRKSDWLHGIPVLLAIIHVIPWPFSPPINWEAVANQILENRQLFITEQTGLFPYWFYSAGRPVLLVAYLIAAWYVVLKSGIIQKAWDINKIWIFFFLGVATTFQLISLLPIVFTGLDLPHASNPAFIVIKCALLLLAITILLQQPRLLYGYLFVDANWKTSDVTFKEKAHSISHSTPGITSPKSNLLPTQVTAYTAAMKKLMEEEQLFLNTDFQISHLAQRLNIPVHQCSYLINNVIGKNFRDWINAHRVCHFISNYPDSVDKMTIEAIAFQSGFKSMATFYNAFKKETGLMPKAYFLEQERLEEGDKLKVLSTKL